MFRGSSLISTHLKVGDRWRVELQTGLPLSAPVPVQTLQDEVRDRQPLAGGQLRCELECVSLEAAQLVGSVDVQPRCVHVKRA